MAEERVLVIEDERKIADFVRRGLTLEGYRVEVAYDGEAGLEIATRLAPDLIVLDVMLPKLDGLAVCRALRTAGMLTPILMLTARDSVPDRVAGLDSGADDYLIKPFAFDELMARVRALLRRRAAADDETLEFGDLTLNTATRQVLRGSRPIELTAKEFEVLELFLRHPRQVLTRDILYERAWGYDFAGESNIIEVYIRYLRSKLEQAGEARLLHTVRGVGYVLREN